MRSQNAFPSFLSKSVNEQMQNWALEIPPATKILIFDFGSWYSERNMNDSRREYRKTVTLMALKLNDISSQMPDMAIYWIDLCISDAGVKRASVRAPSHSREAYRSNSRAAQQILAEIAAGVHFLNTCSALLPRIEHEEHENRALTRDGLHYMVPDVHSVPYFIFESIMHLHAMRLMGPAKIPPARNAIFYQNGVIVFESSRRQLL